MNRHWALKLGDVCEIVSGATPKTGVKEYWDGDIAWATPADLSDLSGHYLDDTPRKITAAGLASCAARVLPANSVLLSSRAPIGHVAINTVPMATNQGFKSLIPKEGLTDAKYLFHWLRYNKEKIQSLGNGATFKEVSKAIVSEIGIDLPPIDEQRRIAAILDKADALRQKRKRAIALLDSLTQSIFLEMFGRKIGDANTPSLHLGDMIAEGDRLNYGVIQPGDHVDGGVPIVRVSDLQNGSVTHGELKLIAPSIHADYKRSILAGNEILVSCVGSIGEVALVSSDEKGFNIARAVARISLSPEYSRVYVAEFLRTQHVQRYFSKESRIVSQPTLNIKQLAETMVPIPHREEAAEFERRTISIREMQNTLGSAKTHKEALFASLQHHAFSGQL